MTNTTVIGVDGGKSKTVCLVADAEYGIRGWGRADSGDKYDVGVPEAVANIETALRQAAQAAAVSLPVPAACFGLAGADWREDIAELEATLTGRNLAQRKMVKNDMLIALRASCKEGVVVSGGTHAAAAVRNRAGKEWYSGWYSVEGPGAVTAGRRALWAVLRAADGRGAATALTPLVLDAAGCADADALLRQVADGHWSDARCARLAPFLFQSHVCCRDAVAADIIVMLGRELAQWAIALLTRFDLLEEAVPVLLTGGMFKAEGPLLHDVVTAAIHAAVPLARVERLQQEPVVGALLYAWEALGVPEEAVLPQVAQTLPPAIAFSPSWLQGDEAAGKAAA